MFNFRPLHDIAHLCSICLLLLLFRDGWALMRLGQCNGKEWRKYCHCVIPCVHPLRPLVRAYFDRPQIWKQRGAFDFHGRNGNASVAWWNYPITDVWCPCWESQTLLLSLSWRQLVILIGIVLSPNKQDREGDAGGEEGCKGGGEAQKKVDATKN